MDLGLIGKKALCARNEEGVKQAVTEMSALGNVVGHAVDAADGAAVAEWATEAGNQRGR